MSVINGDIVRTQELPVKPANISELDIQIATAKNFPRNIKNAIAKAITIVTCDEEIARSCIYSLPRKDYKTQKETFLKGGSIRLAEIMASSWGNIHAAARITRNDGKSITAEAVAWDLENNVKIAREVSVSIVGREGKTYSQDMQVVTGNAACSKALRNVIFEVIPQVFVKQVYNEAVKAAVGESKSQADFQKRVNNAFESFAKYKVPKEKILNFFGKKQNELDIDDLENMIGVFNNIKDGNIAAEFAFNTVERTLAQAHEEIDELNKNLLGD